MHKFDWTYFAALFSVTLGWFLNEFGQWLRTRQSDKKIKKQILYNLLETSHILNRLDTSEITDVLSAKLLERIPKDEQTENTQRQLNQLYSSLLGNIVENNVAEDLDDIEEKYANAVDTLATVDPITAFRLRGKTKILQIFDLIKDYSEQVEQTFPTEIGNFQTEMNATMGVLKPDIIKDAVNDLRDEIGSIAFSIGFFTWYKTKKIMKSTKVKSRGEIDKKIDDLLDKVIPPK